MSALLSLCTDHRFRKFSAKMTAEANCWRKIRAEHKVKAIDDLNRKRMFMTTRMQDLRLSTASKADYRWIEELSRANMMDYNRRYGLIWNGERYSTLLHSLDVLVICSHQHSAGFVSQQINSQDSFCLINDLQLYPQWQKKGMGTWVLEQIEGQAQQQGLKSLRICVFRDNPAKVLYQRHGFRPVSESMEILRLKKALY
ncbi:N-acetyltransferase [Dickeya sp. Secpp 1600]|uniref:GNAT family N-acetyltransferase n=1 Tax=Dickeya sp. Secpp 1600 TaxID=2037915 RepID=UPI00131EFEF9|nr:GNAT family N-acetyltransferase [Dickeya sp. Secpp 1600]